MDFTQAKPGDKVIFRSIPKIWFVNVIKNSEKLEIGKEYTIREIEVASSWCCIKLEEFSEGEFGDDWFSASSFDLV